MQETDFSNIIFTKLRRKDTEPVSELFGDAFDSQNIKRSKMIKYFNDLQSLIRYNNGMSLILVNDPQCEITMETDLGEYLGYASVYVNKESDTKDPYVHIPEIFINPKFQGYGLSHKLVDMLLDRCSDVYQNCEWIDLNVNQTNDKAHSLYQKHGFKEMFEYMIGDVKTIRMAKPLHDDFAFHIYPCYNPDAPKNPGVPEYYTNFTESKKYPVLRFAPYTKKLYGEMIRYNYTIYDDDPNLSKKEVNARAKHDASTLLSAIDKNPDGFKVYCAVTDVSIAGYIVMMKDSNGFWTLMMEHYYDTDKKDLQKLVDYAVKECKINKDPTAVFDTMLSRDRLRGMCKTKYRSTYSYEDYKDTVEPNPEVDDKGEFVVPEKDRFTTVQTPLPNSQPQEPTLRGTEFKDKDVVKPAAVSPKASEPAPPTPTKPTFSTVPTQVPGSAPVEPASKTKINIPPKPIAVPTKPDKPPAKPRIPKTTNIPDDVEKPMDIKNAPNVKSSLGDYEAPEAQDTDEDIPVELRNIASDAISPGRTNNNANMGQQPQPQQQNNRRRLPPMMAAIMNDNNEEQPPEEEQQNDEVAEGYAGIIQIIDGDDGL